MSVRLKPKKNLLDGKQVGRMIRRMAGQLIELNQGVEDVILVGIRTRGVPLAGALAVELERSEGRQIPIGTLDITLYRDDLSAIAPQPLVRETFFPDSIEDRVVVLCDDVLFTGRTIRAALDALVAWGRPKAVQLVVLIDRGHRELPIQPDVAGRTIPTDLGDVVEVRFAATDGEDGVVLMERTEES